jgi:23S rRNA (uracil1939-C5)-methyltransferase
MAELTKNSLIELKITDLGFEGKAIGRTIDDFVVFVENAVPGDIINARIKKVKKNFAEAKCEEILFKSVNRTQPKCEYFGTCNGCKMQNISYSQQLEIKRQSVINAFERIGGFKNINVSPVLGSENIYYYRNKLEFSFSNNKWLTNDDINKNYEDKMFALGFHIPNFIDKVLDINNCSLQSELSNKILNLTRKFFKEKRESIYSTKTQTGFLRYLVIRQSSSTNEILVNLITSDEKKELIADFGNILRENIPEVTTFINTISAKKAQVAIGDYSYTIFGIGCIDEKIGNYKFKILPETFFQTNSLQAKNLFDKIIELGEFNSNDNILDLYCGCGAISLYISEYIHKILGVELNEQSINSARENTGINEVMNCEFILYDVKDYLKELTKNIKKEFNTIILDPPRNGIHPKAVEYLLEYEAPKIIYVSCNPTTQARDVQLLGKKYQITKLQPVDMFPHTFHIENICRLDLK